MYWCLGTGCLHPVFCFLRGRLRSPSHGTQNTFGWGIFADSSECNQWLGGSGSRNRGLLKPQKSFWYMLRWIWKKGKACLKTLYELPQTPLYIPQSDGTWVPIRLKTVNDPEKKLGVYTCPTGQLFPSCCTTFGHRIGICGEAWCAEAPGQICLDGYPLSTIHQTYVWDCCSYSLTADTGGSIAIHLV